MAEQNTPQIPWASLVVVATFVSGSLLVPRAFDLLRPAEKDRAQVLASAPLEVDARLWEDPFVAARRHEDERLQRCQKAPANSRDCDADALAERRDPAALRKRLDADNSGVIDETLVLTVLVPGNPFVGAEESRRRTRFAVLSGLQAERYLPDQAEHVGLLNVDVPPVPGSASRGVSDRLLIPYELLSDRRVLSGRIGTPGDRAASAPTPPGRAVVYRSVLLLWLDEAALPTPKLDAVAYALHAVVGSCTERCPKLAVIGPSSSEGLRQALTRLDELAQRRGVPIRGDMLAGYKLLARAHVFNNSSTVAEPDLIDTLTGSDVQTFVRARLALLTGTEQVALEFERTIATDDALIEVLICELEQRLSVGRRQRVVTITESDSLHARSIDRRLRKALVHRAADRPEDRLYFFRGVDGVTVRDSADRSTAPSKPADTRTPNIEWPESRDQLDYLRRMAGELKRSEGVHAGPGGRAEPIDAIGIFANDVHDKLLILQALHETFPDKVFFTTDMDARLLHPRTLPFTRNLIVASSLPLQFPIRRSPPEPPEPPKATPGLGAAVAAPATASAPAPVPRQLHAGTPPFRDVYQAATYVATRLAACARFCDDMRAQVKAAIDAPSVYEIGRDRAIPLVGLDLVGRRAEEPTAGFEVGLATFALMMGFGLLVWPSTPSLRAAREALTRRMPIEAPIMTAGFTAAYGVMLGATLASVVEALTPGRLGLHGFALWSALGGLMALCIHPGAARLAAALPHRPAAFGWAVATLGALLLAGIGWAAMDPAQPYAGEPMAWVQGVSGWPSHFLNLLAVVAGIVSLDLACSQLVRTREADEAWLALASRAAPASTPPIRAPRGERPWSRRLLALTAWARSHSLLAWQGGRETSAVEFAPLWSQFLRRSASAPRLMRVGFWYAFTIAAIVVLFIALSDYYVPEVPVRGTEHRKIISDVLILALLLLPLVIVVVADATMLCWRLIRLLSRGRTVYPPETVKRFADELGPAHAQLWRTPIAADPAQRDDARPPAVAHSLLDDWIDMQVVARRTAAVAPLVLAPFVMLALMVLARSRLFDNWALTWPIAASVALYVVWLGVLAWLLKQAAETARSLALARMNADLRWLAGAGQGREALVAPMQRLIASVENQRAGAFAPLLDQWFFKALMVPLGGAGGAQLLERLLAP